MNSPSRITQIFTRLRAQNRAALVTFVMAGDPDYARSLELVKALPEAGADIIELGMAFSDPTADGPAIQAAGLRALKAGITLKRTLELVRVFRAADDTTPLVLMGYFNPVLHYGVHDFVRDAKGAGVDGLIIVDLPPEEDVELRLPARKAGLDFIRLATPTTDAARLPEVIRHASGFLYYVAVAGTTGSGSAAIASISRALDTLRCASDLPIAVGFGIRTPEQAADVARVAAAAVVGSAIVDRIAESPENPNEALALVRDLACAISQARQR
jgi:tryptophan synthase alpha chain